MTLENIISILSVANILVCASNFILLKWIKDFKKASQEYIDSLKEIINTKDEHIDFLEKNRTSVKELADRHIDFLKRDNEYRCDKISRLEKIVEVQKKYIALLNEGYTEKSADVLSEESEYMKTINETDFEILRLSIEYNAELKCRNGKKDSSPETDSPVGNEKGEE